ncbi:MAG: TonB-dependent receptor [Bacteroidota bacterium]
MKRHHATLSTLLCAMLQFPWGSADAGTNGILEGTVRDKRTSEPLAGVTVMLVGLNHGTSTDVEGRFELQNIRAGKYDVRFSHIGYRPFLLRGVAVNPDLRTRLTVTLEPADLTLDEITVTQEKPLIQTDVTGTTFIVSGEEVRALPIDNVFDIVGYKAGTTREGNIRGGKTTEVVYLVDGLPIQDMIAGGPAAALPRSSVFGMSIYTGGFEPEYGNALSGVVNIVTRTGGNDHRFMVRADKDNLFGGTQVSRATQFEASASGPIVGDRLFYVGVVSGSVTDTRWWQDFREFFGSPIERSLNGIAKIDMAVTPTFRLGTQFIFSRRRWRDYDFAWRYNLAGLPPEDKQSNRIALTLSHSLADNFFYTASISRASATSDIGDGSREQVPVDNPYQYDFFLRYVVAGEHALWERTRQTAYTVKADGTLKAGRAHLLKFGIEANAFHLNSDIVKYEPRRTYFGKPLVNEPQLNFSSSYSYGPRSGAVYVQDKVDLLDEGLLLNFGARFDFLDPRASRPAIEATLQGDTAYVFTPGQAVPASVKAQISPRFGAAMPVAENCYVFVNLGWYVQYPLFNYLYRGIDRVALARGISAITGNPNLEPERSKIWEISIKYSLDYNLVASATFFKKETSDLIDTKTFIRGDSKFAGNFGFAEYVNTPYADAYGLELVLTRERGEVVTGEVSYSYMVARGTSGSSTDGFYVAQYGLPPGVREYPLSWDQTHTVKALATVSLPWDVAVTGALQWHTGRPYTRYPTATGFEPVVAGLFIQNNDRMPSTFNLDMKAERSFRLDWWNGVVATVYCDVRNLTNQNNVSWIDSNGRVGGELDDPGGYVIGRRTLVGLQVTF